MTFEVVDRIFNISTSIGVHTCNPRCEGDKHYCVFYVVKDSAVSAHVKLKKIEKVYNAKISNVAELMEYDEVVNGLQIQKAYGFYIEKKQARDQW